MAQNITLMGASYSDVPAVNLPKTGGGSARFDDTSDADAVASDIASGKTAYVNGQKVTGTSSGGGGGSAVIIDTIDDAGGTIRSITTTDEVHLQSNKTVTPTASQQTILPDSGFDGLAQVVVEASSASGSSSWTLLGTRVVTVSTSSTTATEIATIDCGSGAYTSDDIIWVHVRGQSGKRTGYFYGSDAFFLNGNVANGSASIFTSASVSTIRCELGDGRYTTYSGQYGVYGYSIAQAGIVSIRARYNGNYSYTIDDDFDIYVYKLTLPQNWKAFE